MDKQKTLEFINAQTQKTGWLLNDAHSDFVLGEYAEFLKSGKFPYLDDVHNFIKQRHGLELDRIADKNLHGLVYTASKDYREARDKAEGWTLATQEILERNAGKFIEYKAEGLLGSSIIKMKVFKTHDGKFYFMKPRARTRGIPAGYMDQKIREMA